MFRTFRFKWAVVRAAYILFQRGMVDEITRKHMAAVAGAGLNLTLGVHSMKVGASTSANAAAALVFARLAVVSVRTPGGDVSADQWQYATSQALRNAGASRPESYLAAENLYELFRAEASCKNT